MVAAIYVKCQVILIVPAILMESDDYVYMRNLERMRIEEPGGEVRLQLRTQTGGSVAGLGAQLGGARRADELPKDRKLARGERCVTCSGP